MNAFDTTVQILSPFSHPLVFRLPLNGFTELVFSGLSSGFNEVFVLRCTQNELHLWGFPLMLCASLRRNLSHRKVTWKHARCSGDKGPWSPRAPRSVTEPLARYCCEVPGADRNSSVSRGSPGYHWGVVRDHRKAPPPMEGCQLLFPRPLLQVVPRWHYQYEQGALPEGRGTGEGPLMTGAVYWLIHTAEAAEWNTCWIL